MVLPDPDAAILDAHEAIEKLETKLSNLADQCEEDRSDFIGRIEALEERSYPEFDAEHERRADWKRTYDAALTGYIAKYGHCDDDTLRNAAAVDADHAHGKLEPTQTPSTTHRPGAGLVVCPECETPYHVTDRAEVAALVKAARDVLNGRARDVDSAGDRYVIDTTLQALTRALAPFEDAGRSGSSR
jgi:hypothetical protein